MLKPWRPWEPCELEPVEVDELPDPQRSMLLGRTIEVISIGLVPVGDYRVVQANDPQPKPQTVRWFQSSDSAVLCWVADRAGALPEVGLASLLEDGTCVKSVAEPPHAPWSCCRFPVYVNFGAGCALEDLLLMHLTSLAELEHGCGPTLRYGASQISEVFAYMSALEHETEYGLGAPAEMLPELPVPSVQELVAH